MGLFFRRSASFGPLRFNFSKSGVGASVGVKGARLTLTPKGTTYITVGRGGLYYRQTLSAGARPSQPRNEPQVVSVQPSLDEIRTADVSELLASSKSELVENLNKRARMFNPALLLFVLAAICGAVGFSQISGLASSEAIPALPNVSTLTDGSRQSNNADEYALILARYGQPSSVNLSQQGSVPVRTAIYAGAHVAIVSVPAGCVDAYAFFEAHKGDTAPAAGLKRRKGSNRMAQPTPPVCVLPDNSASTIVEYQDGSGAAIDMAAAQRSLADLGTKSDVHLRFRVCEHLRPASTTRKRCLPRRASTTTKPRYIPSSSAWQI